jgi:uncharacterized membrane protein
MTWIGVGLSLIGGMLVFASVVAVAGNWPVFYTGLALALLGGVVLFVARRLRRSEDRRQG